MRSDRSGSTRVLLGLVLLPLLGVVPSGTAEAGGGKGNAGDKLGPLTSQVADAFDRGGAAAAAGKARGLGLKVQAGATVTVVLTAPGKNGANAIPKGLIANLGGQVLASSRNFVRVQVGPGNLRQLSALPGVGVVRAPLAAKPSGAYGPVQSESVALTNAAALHVDSITGSGVKVGVVDGGFRGLDDRIAEGELGANTVRVVLPGQTLGQLLDPGASPHGTGVAEHVQDMAPDAQIYCIQVGDAVDMQNAADYLSSNGIKIANHSMGWVNGSYYDDTGDITTIVNNSSDNDGVFWCVAAGNDRERHWRLAGWSDGDGDGWLDFGPGGDEDLELLPSSVGWVYLSFNWDQYGITNRKKKTDLDLYVYDKDGNLAASSVANQSLRFVSPVEVVSFAPNPAAAPYRVRVAYYSGPTNNLDMTLFSFYNDLEPAHQVFENSLMEPADGHGAFSVAAADQAQWTANDADFVAESYSSMGPTNDGRAKPQLVAPDGTSSVTYGTAGSFGTSFSSPTTAGAAALILSQDLSQTASDLWVALQSEASLAGDPGGPGMDSEFGAGKLTLPAPPQPEAPVITSFAVTSATAGQQYLYDVEATGNPAPTFSLTGQPTGMQIDGATGVVTWTPGDGDVGQHSYTVTATNSEGSDSQPVTVTVDPAPANPEIHVSAIDVVLVSGSRGRWSASATVTIVDAQGNPVEGADVVGHWSGKVSGNAGPTTTDSNGQAAFSSSQTKGGGTITFTVDDVSKSGCVYNSSQNVESSDSVSK